MDYTKAVLTLQLVDTYCFKYQLANTYNNKDHEKFIVGVIYLYWLLILVADSFYLIVAKNIT